MINSISPQISSYDASSSTSSTSATFEETVQSILANYDSESLSADDASEIVEAFSDAGITASSELADAMESLGFDAREVGSLAGVGPSEGGMPPPPPSAEESNEISDLLSELLNSEEDDASTSLDSILDYTSRILSLNDESKEEVMSLFETYSSETSDLSSTEISNIIKSSLQDILGNENNYNTVSFYA